MEEIKTLQTIQNLIDLALKNFEGDFMEDPNVLKSGIMIGGAINELFAAMDFIEEKINSLKKEAMPDNP